MRDGATVALTAAVAALDAIDGVDSALDELAARARSLSLEADDVAAELRRYAEDLDGDPGELEVVEERLAVLDRLERKHGGSIAAVLEHGERCRARRDELAGAEVALEETTAQLAEAQADLDGRARSLRAAREKAAPKLADAVRARLGALAMDGASFEIALTPRDETTPTGADAVEFLIAPNPGVPPAAAARDRIGRRGLTGDARAARGRPTRRRRDPGVRRGRRRDRRPDRPGVGEELRALAAGRQIVCITHLPQIASLAARHFAIEKDPSVEPARTTVRELAKGEIVGELVRMLGAEADDVAARRHAKELLKAA
jgi:DNA repair protein RecN (Recombination protein N)